jgi:hypothetical protein
MQHESNERWQGLVSCSWHTQEVQLSGLQEHGPKGGSLHETWLQKENMRNTWMQQQCCEEWRLHHPWCQALLHVCGMWQKYF